MFAVSQIDYFSSEAIREDLRGKTVRGGVYVGAAQGVCALISLAAVPVLARLLDPADYGLIAMVAVFTNFARMFVDAGLSMATVQQEKITAPQVSNLFWIASSLGVLVAIVVACLSPVVAWIFSEPRLIPITLALTISYVLSGLTIQHQALLRRRMQFRSLAAIQIASVLLSQIVGIAWAWRRYEQADDYWALVWIPLTTAAVVLVGSWMACPWRPNAPKRGVGTRQMVGFGANLTGFNFANYFARNADKMLIAWWWGPTLLGYYERAYKIAFIPIQMVSAPLASVTITSLSRITEDAPRYRRYYLFVTESLLMFIMPAMALAFSTSDWVVLMLLGPEWTPSVPVFRWLVLAIAFQPLSHTTGWLFVSQGRSREMFLWGCFGAATIVVAFLIGLPYGPATVAAMYALSGIFVRLPVVCWLAGKKGPVRLGDLTRTLPLPILSSATIVLSVSAFRYLVPEMSPLLGMFLFPVISLVIVLAVLLSNKHGRSLLSRLKSLLPSRIGSP